jgi:hypothetical protein
MDAHKLEMFGTCVIHPGIDLDLSGFDLHVYGKLIIHGRLQVHSWTAHGEVGEIETLGILTQINTPLNTDVVKKCQKLEELQEIQLNQVIQHFSKL